MYRKPRKPALSIGLDKNGNVIEIRVAGKKVDADMDSKHKCAAGVKTLVYKLKFCAPSKGVASASNPSAVKSKKGKVKGKVSPRGVPGPCCMLAGGRQICWPPCV